MGAQALDIVKQAKVAQILGGSAERRSARSSARLGSRESLESVQYDASDEVSLYPSVTLISSPSSSPPYLLSSFTIGNQPVLTSSAYFSSYTFQQKQYEIKEFISSSSYLALLTISLTLILYVATIFLIHYSKFMLFIFFIILFVFK
jgi:hypothetical protein